MSWFYHGNDTLEIDQKDNLDLRERLLEGQFTSWIQEDVDRAVREYSSLSETQNGKISNTDYARELSDVYSRSWENRLRWADAVHEPASALAEEVYSRRLRDYRLQKGRVLFTGGGPGSGKTFTLQETDNDLGRMVDAIYDTTLAGEDSAKAKIDFAHNESKLPIIFYVHRPADLAAELIFDRGLESGRIVPFEVAARCHFEAQRTLFSLRNDFTEDELSILTWDNSGEKEDIGETTISSIYKRRYSDLDSVLELTKEGLDHARRRALQDTSCSDSKVERVYDKIFRG